MVKKVDFPCLTNQKDFLLAHLINGETSPKPWFLHILSFFSLDRRQTISTQNKTWRIWRNTNNGENYRLNLGQKSTLCHCNIQIRVNHDEIRRTLNQTKRIIKLTKSKNFRFPGTTPRVNYTQIMTILQTQYTSPELMYTRLIKPILDLKCTILDRKLTRPEIYYRQDLEYTRPDLEHIILDLQYTWSRLEEDYVNLIYTILDQTWSILDQTRPGVYKTRP